MAKRIIPNLYIAIQEGTDFSAIQNNSQIQEILFNSIVDGIKEAAKTNRKEATIIELNSSGNYIAINRNDWKPSLEKAQEYFTNLEQYEVCAAIQKIIESINSYGSKRVYRKTSRANKSNNRNSKYLKTS
jgi:hypothetical protein